MTGVTVSCPRVGRTDAAGVGGDEEAATRARLSLERFPRKTHVVKTEGTRTQARAVQSERRTKVGERVPHEPRPHSVRLKQASKQSTKAVLSSAQSHHNHPKCIAKTTRLLVGVRLGRDPGRLLLGDALAALRKGKLLGVSQLGRLLPLLEVGLVGDDRAGVLADLGVRLLVHVLEILGSDVVGKVLKRALVGKVGREGGSVQKRSAS